MRGLGDCPDMSAVGSRAKPGRGSEDRQSPPEAGAFKKIHNMNFKALLK